MTGKLRPTQKGKDAGKALLIGIGVSIAWPPLLYLYFGVITVLGN